MQRSISRKMDALSSSHTPIKIFATTGSQILAEQVQAELASNFASGNSDYKVVMGRVNVSTFSNENMEVQVDNVRDHIVLVIHTQAPPVSNNLIQLFGLLDAINNAHPRHVFVVFPYMPYSRSDRKNRPRISVLGQRLPEVLNKVLGVRRVMLIEAHDAHIKQYFAPTADEVPGMPMLVEHIRKEIFAKLPQSECVVVFADAGAAKRYEEVPHALHLQQAYIHKMRPANDESPVIKGVTGDVKGRHCLLVDDEILTGNTLLKDAELLKSEGAASVRMFAVHGILEDQTISQEALMKKLMDSVVDEIVVTDTVPLNQKAACLKGKLTVIPVAPLLAEACKRMILGESLSALHRLESKSGA